MFLSCIRNWPYKSRSAQDICAAISLRIVCKSLDILFKYFLKSLFDKKTYCNRLYISVLFTGDCDFESINKVLNCFRIFKNLVFPKNWQLCKINFDQLVPLLGRWHFLSSEVFPKEKIQKIYYFAHLFKMSKFVTFFLRRPEQ